jgi:hypothetical protein
MGILLDILREKWFWIIVGSFILILIVPILIVWIIVQLPTPLNAIVTIGIVVIGWGLVAGYKEWSKSKEKEYEKI